MREGSFVTDLNDLVKDHTGLTDASFVNDTEALLLDTVDELEQEALGALRNLTLLQDLSSAYDDYTETIAYCVDCLEFFFSFCRKCSTFVMPAMYVASHVTFATALYSVFTMLRSYKTKTLELRASGGVLDGEPRVGDPGGHFQGGKMGLQCHFNFRI